MQVRLSILQGRHQDVRAVWGVHHVQHLVDFEQFLQLHFAREHVDESQPGAPLSSVVKASVLP